MIRIDRLRHGVDRTARILEIGPGYNPVAPKSDGWNTHVVDHATREELRRKYSSAAVNLNAFEEVDTVWNGCALHEAIPAELLGSFDIIIASHVIEHVPDLVGFLQSATRLLQPAGVVSLAIPDRRFCFDYFKQPSGTGDVLEAFLQQRTRHSLRSSWNHVAYATRRDGLEAWAQHAVFNPEFIDSFDTAASVFQEYRNGGPGSYVDCHAWLLTPAAFKLIILELGLLGLIDQRVAALYGPEGCEFFATLAQGAERFNDPAQARSLRKCLLLEQLREWREQLDYAIAGGLTPAAGSSSGAVAARFSDRIAEQDRQNHGTRPQSGQRYDRTECSIWTVGRGAGLRGEVQERDIRAPGRAGDRSGGSRSRAQWSGPRPSRGAECSRKADWAAVAHTEGCGLS